MSTNQIDLIECKTAKEFVDELDPSHSRWVKDGWRNRWIFRGQLDLESWLLIPTALRTGSQRDSKQFEIGRVRGEANIVHVRTYLPHEDVYNIVCKYSEDCLRNLLIQLFSEITNLREFFELTDTLNLSNSLILLSDFPEFGTDFVQKYISSLGDQNYRVKFWREPSIAIAQHHGVATRLLDWTKHPLYAAFFACGDIAPKSDSEATHIAVYAINSFYLKHFNDEVRLIEVDKGHSPYIHAQEGVFTLDTNADIEFLKTGKWRSILDASVGTIYKITLPVSELQELIRILWLKRVTKAHMMPSLDNVILALNTKWRWQLDNPDKQD